jgi:hypothetical protein
MMLRLTGKTNDRVSRTGNDPSLTRGSSGRRAPQLTQTSWSSGILLEHPTHFQPGWIVVTLGTQDNNFSEFLSLLKA